MNMIDDQQLQQVRETTGTVVTSIHDTNQATMDTIMTMQDRNLQFAQNTFLHWMELLMWQTESAQRWQQQWQEQVRKQQEGLQRLMISSTQTYMNFLLTPFSFVRRLNTATEEALRREREQVG